MKTIAKCDVSHQPISLNEGFLVANTRTGSWYFCRQGQEDNIPHKYVLMGALEANGQQEFIHLLVGLSEKTWFDPHAFFEKIHSFK